MEGDNGNGGSAGRKSNESSTTLVEPKSEFKPGMKVKIKEDAEKIQTAISLPFLQEMNMLKGKVVTLKEELSSGNWLIKEDVWVLAKEWFEPAEEESKSLKEKPSKVEIQESEQESLVKTPEIFSKSLKLLDKADNLLFGVDQTQSNLLLTSEKSESLEKTLYSLGVALYHCLTGSSELTDLSFLDVGYQKPEDIAQNQWRIIYQLLVGKYESLETVKEEVKKILETLKQETEMAKKSTPIPKKRKTNWLFFYQVLW